MFAAGCRALLACVVLAGCSNWPGGGFDAGGPEMPQLEQAIALRPGMVVADVGAGRGQLTLALAAGVGPGGHVFASDIDPARVRHGPVKRLRVALNPSAMAAGDGHVWVTGMARGTATRLRL